MTNTQATVKPSLRKDEQQFVEEIASLLAPWGLSPSAGRVYGYLLLKQEALSLDQIAADLEISKVGAWNAARSLETFGHLQRHGTPGSKRALYGPSDNFAAPLLAQASLLGSIAALLQNCASDTARTEAAPPIQERARFYLSMREAMEEKIDELNSQRARPQK